MMNLKNRLLTVGLLTLGGLWAAPVGAEWRSPGGDLSMQWQGPLTAVNCSLAEPHGSYQLGGFVSGVLYPMDCSAAALAGDRVRYHFVDTTGNKRCVGSLDLFFLETQDGQPAVEAIWYIDGEVPGYQCSLAGSIDTAELYWYGW